MKLASDAGIVEKFQKATREQETRAPYAIGGRTNSETPTTVRPSRDSTSLRAIPARTATAADITNAFADSYLPDSSRGSKFQFPPAPGGLVRFNR